MIGAIAGDIIGSIYEYEPIKTTKFDIFNPRCVFTDDTVLTIALADSIMSGVPYRENIRKFMSWYPGRGYGSMLTAWANSWEDKQGFSFGNGAAMRISPVGYICTSQEATLAAARVFTSITHGHPDGIKGGQAVALAVYMARRGQTKVQIKLKVEALTKWDIGKHTDNIRKDYSYDVTAKGTVPAAVRSFYDSETYEEAVRIAISLGGDADTLACIAGAIAEPYFMGVSSAVRKMVYDVLDDRLRSILIRFENQFVR